MLHGSKLLQRKKKILKKKKIKTCKFHAINNNGNKFLFLVNGNKTKYMQVARAVRNDEHLCCGQHKFEHVKEISYPGSQMNQTNSISSEIQARILSGNRRYYAYYGKLVISTALNS